MAVGAELLKCDQMGCCGRKRLKNAALEGLNGSLAHSDCELD